MRTIGIDFGTCNLKGAERRKNGDICSVKLGKQIDKPIVPNVIIYEKKDEKEQVLVGDIALKKPVSEQDRIRNIKSHLQEKEWKRELSFGKIVNAYDVTCDIMQYLYGEIQGGSKEQNIGATITVPVNFSKRQQLLIKKAAEQAGFQVNAVITEPFAAAFYLLQDCMDESEEHNVLIFDFGGGTLDLCLVELKDTKKGKKIETKASIGITYGGNNINEDILKDILRQKEPEEVYQALEGQENKFDEMINQFFFAQEINAMKEELFEEDEVDETESRETIVMLKNGDAIDFGEITVKEIYDLFRKKNWEKRIGALFDRLFEDSDWIAEDVTDIFMVGGSSSIPFFRTVIETYFQKNSSKDTDDLFALNDEVDKEERVYASVSSGAVIYSELLQEDTFILKDKIPFLVYTKGMDGQKRTKLTRADAYKDYVSSVAPLTEEMKQSGEVGIYQTIFGEEEKEVYLGAIAFDKEVAEYATLYRLSVEKEGNVQMELGYMAEDEEEAAEDLFCVEWRGKLDLSVEEE